MRWSVVLHLVLAVAAVGAAVHAAVFARRSPDAARTRRLAGWALVASLAAYVVGALIYPTYKVEIRVAWLEQAHPEATRAFDLKEQLVALALPMQLALWWLLRARAARPALVRGLALATAALLLTAALLAAGVETVHGHP
jgi:hypothetical protein